MKLVTFNIRCESAVDGVNRFFFRRGLILDYIEKQQPDVICFQEMKHEMNSYMREHLAHIGYTLVGGGRGSDWESEHNPVAFKHDKYELLGLDTTWLSETPYVPGSRYPLQSSCPRIITWALLRPLENGSQPFHIFNTHLDHQQADARIRGAKRVCEVIKEKTAHWDFPFALCGDFNAYPQDEELGVFYTSPLGMTEQTVGMGTTWHDWGRGTSPQIDYIFTRGFERVGEVVKWDQELNGIYLSDHYPLEAELVRTDGGAA